MSATRPRLRRGAFKGDYYLLHVTPETANLDMMFQLNWDIFCAQGSIKSVQLINPRRYPPGNPSRLYFWRTIPKFISILKSLNYDECLISYLVLLELVT